MYRRILVPVDGNTTSALGLEHAIGLAKDQNVRVLNVLDETFMIPAADAYPVGDNFPARLIESDRRESA